MSLQSQVGEAPRLITLPLKSFIFGEMRVVGREKHVQILSVQGVETVEQSQMLRVTLHHLWEQTSGKFRADVGVVRYAVFSTVQEADVAPGQAVERLGEELEEVVVSLEALLVCQSAQGPAFGGQDLKETLCPLDHDDGTSQAIRLVERVGLVNAVPGFRGGTLEAECLTTVRNRDCKWDLDWVILVEQSLGWEKVPQISHRFHEANQRPVIVQVRQQVQELVQDNIFPYNRAHVLLDIDIGTLQVMHIINNVDSVMRRVLFLNRVALRVPNWRVLVRKLRDTLSLRIFGTAACP